MDPTTVVTMLVVNNAAQSELVKKLLGPPVEYIGEQAKGLLEKTNVNLNTIFSKALRLLGPRVEDPGQVHPRVLKAVWDEGRFVEDDLTAEYFAGILAAARTEEVSDDRGVSFVALIRSMSVFQLRLHYLFYSALRHRFTGSQLRMHVPSDRAHLYLFIPMDVFRGDVLVESEDLPAILDHTVVGLERLDLVNRDVVFGKHSYLKERWPEAPGEGLIMGPTPFGVELYLWAHGRRDVSPSLMFEKTLQLNSQRTEIPGNILVVPLPESPLGNRSEITTLRDRIARHADSMEARFRENGIVPAFPNDLRNSIYQVVEYLQGVRPQYVFVVGDALEKCINPPSEQAEATGPQRISAVKDLAKALTDVLSTPINL